MFSVVYKMLMHLQHFHKAASAKSLTADTFKRVHMWGEGGQEAPLLTLGP